MKNFYFSILIHVLLGFIVFIAKPIMFLYPIIIVLLGLFYIINNKNKNNEVLIAAAYISGAEVFMRMTEILVFHETGKYSILIFMFLGLIYNGFSRNAFLYFVVLFLLIPGVIVAFLNYHYDVELQKSIVFNLLGPVALLVSSIYTFNRTVNAKQLNNILLAFGLPLISMVVYVLLYQPTNQELFLASESNHNTSGGYGPNQVSTMLGFGMFVFFSLFLFFSKSFFQKIIYLALALIMGYRSLLTFSRGGLIAGVLMIVGLIVITYFNVNFVAKIKIKIIAIALSLVGLVVFSYTVLVTDGMISNRYSGKDAKGREKISKLSGREDIAAAEYQLFLENPIFGIGVGRNKIEKAEIIGKEAASHNEITRLLAEHGSFGLVAFIFMFFIPILFFLNNKNQLFLVPFFLFWFLTINHAAIRIAAPAFIYALTLLKVSFVEENQNEVLNQTTI